jgi:uncharacterized protein YjiS (DUF1127 family)
MTHLSLSRSLSRARRCAPRRRISLPDLIALARQRRRLARLDDDALDDLGLTRHAARQEARRPVWDVPEHWRE